MLILRGKSGIIDLINEQVRRLENRLAVDDAARQHKRPATLRPKAREMITGEIGTLNLLIGTLQDAELLTDEEYDRRFEKPNEPKAGATLADTEYDGLIQQALSAVSDIITRCPTNAIEYRIARAQANSVHQMLQNMLIRKVRSDYLLRL
jgi:hypothetical protein